MSLNELCAQAKRIADAHGFKDATALEKIALIPLRAERSSRRHPGSQADGYHDLSREGR